MNYIDLLLKLDTGNISDIIEILNNSIYASEYIETEQSNVIHTGFRCETQHGKVLTLLFDIKEEVIIRQVYNPGISYLPICGVCMDKGGYDYYNCPCAEIITAMTLDCKAGIKHKFELAPQYWHEIKNSEVKATNYDSGEEETISHFSVLKSTGEEIKKIPLQNKSVPEVFFTGDKFIIKGDPEFDDWYDKYRDPFEMD